MQYKKTLASASLATSALAAYAPPEPWSTLTPPGTYPGGITNYSSVFGIAVMPIATSSAASLAKRQDVVSQIWDGQIQAPTAGAPNAQVATRVEEAPARATTIAANGATVTIVRSEAANAPRPEENAQVTQTLVRTETLPESTRVVTVTQTVNRETAPGQTGPVTEVVRRTETLPASTRVVTVTENVNRVNAPVVRTETLPESTRVVTVTQTVNRETAPGQTAPVTEVVRRTETLPASTRVVTVTENVTRGNVPAQYNENVRTVVKTETLPESTRFVTVTQTVNRETAPGKTGPVTETVRRTETVPASTRVVTVTENVNRANIPAPGTEAARTVVKTETIPASTRVVTTTQTVTRETAPGKTGPVTETVRRTETIPASTRVVTVTENVNRPNAPAQGVETTRVTETVRRTEAPAAEAPRTQTLMNLPVVSQIWDGQIQEPAKATGAAAPAATRTAAAAGQLNDGQVKAPADSNPSVVDKDGRFVAPGDAVSCKADSTLELHLKDGVLTDAKGRIGSIVANHQFQFDGPPPQAGAIYAKGWSITPDGFLALGDSDVFYQCRSGDFYNLYNEHIAYQCSPVRLEVVGLVDC